MLIKNGKVFLRDGKFHDVALSFGKTIEGVGEFEGEGLDAAGCYVVPGFVDVHTHGAMNRDHSDGDPEALSVTSRYYAENGVTSFLATTMTLKEHQLMPAMACVKNAGALPGARCAGIHPRAPSSATTSAARRTRRTCMRPTRTCSCVSTRLRVER